MLKVRDVTSLIDVPKCISEKAVKELFRNHLNKVPRTLVVSTVDALAQILDNAQDQNKCEAEIVKTSVVNRRSV